MSQNSKTSGEATPPAPARKSAAELIAVLKSEAGHKEKADACRELAVVGTSKRTIESDWTVARAWLRRELSGEPPAPPGGA